MSSRKVQRAADVLAVAVLAVSGQVSVWGTAAGALDGGRLLHAGLLALITVPLLVRRRWPLVVLVLVSVATGVQYELGGDVFQPWFALLLALYVVAAHADLPVAAAGASVVAVVVLAADVPRLADGAAVDDVVPAWLVMAGVWAFGRWMRRRRDQTAALSARLAAAEQDRAARAAQAVAEERGRIARELHDLVAHSMGVIVIQAQAGQRALEADPGAARRSLTAIETTSRQGMAELRRLLGLLSGADETETSPQPGLQGLDGLLDQVRTTGLRVQATVDVDRRGLPAGADLAAYRIVQEALTNVLKHADATSVEVVVRQTGGCVEIEVSDDGAGRAAGGDPGRGLVGMRERAVLYDGLLEAGSAPGGGYRVRARLGVGALP
jgi:signal transduction histidine kinase